MSDEQPIEEIREKKKEELTGEDEESDSSSSPSEPVHISGAADLDETVADADVVLADFYADWCGPCKMLEPIVADLAKETAATVAKVDVDANQQLAAQYGVQGVPTLVLFADGEPVERMVGVQQKDALAQKIAQHS
ncbi:MULTISPECIES: thioredoxin [Salinibaculum]|uniref:thioredoxin n=1 Tax=Salinibaculum TaxID=2732368 RepID=UPI0030D5F64B